MLQLLDAPERAFSPLLEVSAEDPLVWTQLMLGRRVCLMEEEKAII